MSETLSLERPLAELIHPRITPEMGFQSYEMLKGDAAYRERERTAFLNDEVTLPVLDYPNLNEQELQHQIRTLDTVLSASQRHPDTFVGDAVWDSAGYRMAEMYWLLSSKKLNRIHGSLSEAEIDELASKTQELNEQLYGIPEKEITEAIHAEIWAQIDNKELVGVAQGIKQELEHGISITAGGEIVTIPSLKRTSHDRLPETPDQLLETLREKLYAENNDIIDLVQRYHEEAIIQRPEDEQVFSPQDILNLFQSVHELRDPGNESGVAIIEDPNATSLSWDSSMMAVKVGGERTPIKSVDEMIAKILHEYIVHGGRSIHGSRSRLPVLGTGVYTEADEGELSDYLTFEEGLAITCELAVHPENRGWTAQIMEKTLALELAYEGQDFRQIFETLWRSRLLMGATSGQEPSEAMIQKARKAAYASVVRIFRSTPTELPRAQTDGSPRVLTYNKDLAYLKGRLSVIEFFKQYGDDPAMIDLAFKAKIDPLNHRQLALVRAA